MSERASEQSRRGRFFVIIGRFREDTERKQQRYVPFLYPCRNLVRQHGGDLEEGCEITKQQSRRTSAKNAATTASQLLFASSEQ